MPDYRTKVVVTRVLVGSRRRRWDSVPPTKVGCVKGSGSEHERGLNDLSSQNIVGMCTICCLYIPTQPPYLII